MQLDSPTPDSHKTAKRVLESQPAGKPGSPTPQLTPLPPGVDIGHGQGLNQSASQRGFPPEQANAVTDGRGFPFLEEDFRSINKSSRHLYRPTPSPTQPRRSVGDVGVVGGTMPGDNADAGTTANNQALPSSREVQNQRRNLFLSPFSSTLPPEKGEHVPTSKYDANRTSWVGRAGMAGSGRFRTNGGVGEDGCGSRVAGGAGAGGMPGSAAPSPPSPSRQTKGSHAKLDLLLHEVQRLNGRLDTIGDRLGALEEERIGTGEGRGA